MKFLFTILIAVSLQVHAKTVSELKAGTYRGETGQGVSVELFVKDYPGREGSFLAVIVKDKSRGHAYLVDQFSEKKYGMTPLTVLSNAVVGVENTNPSLSLTITKEKSKNIIKILSNNSNNSLGFNESMKIKLKDISGRSRIVSTDVGTYKISGNKSAATISSQDKNHESALTMNLESISGDFVLREVRPSIHLPLKSTMTSTGLTVSDNTNMMAFFIDKECLFGKGDFMVLMEANSGKLTYLRKR